jgi:hypothetical protein
MSPSAGRFLGRDPIKYRKQDVHLYEFVSSSPSRKTDPFGLFAPDDDIKKGEEAGLELNFYYPTCENTLPVNPKK